MDARCRKTQRCRRSSPCGKQSKLTGFVPFDSRQRMPVSIPPRCEKGGIRFGCVFNPRCNSAAQVGSISIDTVRRLSFSAAKAVLPPPPKQSSTMSPGNVVASIACSSIAAGFSAGVLTVGRTDGNVHTSVNLRRIHHKRIESRLRMAALGQLFPVSHQRLPHLLVLIPTRVFLPSSQFDHSPTVIYFSVCDNLSGSVGAWTIPPAFCVGAERARTGSGTNFPSAAGSAKRIRSE